MIQEEVMRSLLYLFFTFTLIGIPLAHASEVIGSIQGQFNDELRKWSTIRVEGAAATANYGEFIPGRTSIHIQGHEGGKFAIPKSLSIDFTLGANNSIDEPSLTFVPGTSFSDYYEAKNSDVMIIIETLEMDNETWEISGNVSSMIVRTKREGLNFEVDENNVIDLNLAFETKLFKQE